MFLKSKNRNYVFIFSLILTGIIVVVGIFLPDRFNYISTKLFNALVDKFSPMYLLLMLGIFAFSIYLACQLKTILKLSDKCSRKRGLFKNENSVAQNSAKISM